MTVCVDVIGLVDNFFTISLTNKYLTTLLFCSFLTINFQLSAQKSSQDRVSILSGQVLSEDSLKVLESVHVSNRRTRAGAVSNENGFFSIAMLPSDTLEITSVGYLSKLYTIPDSLRGRDPFVVIKLRPKTYKLKEVIVSAYQNPVLLKRYLDNVRIKKKELPQPTIGGVKPKPKGETSTVSLGTGANGGATIDGALTGLANLFNKRAIQLRKIEKLKAIEKIVEAEKVYQRFVDSKFNEEIISEVTGLQGDRLSAFVTFCDLPQGFIYRASEYQLVEAIYQQFYLFEKTHAKNVERY